MSSVLTMCSLNQSYVLILLNVTHGLNTLTMEKPLCRMAASIGSVSCFRLLENDWATKVAPAASASSSGDSGLSMEPSGVLFVLKPYPLRGDVCPFVRP